MAMLMVQQIGHPAATGSSGGDAGLLLALAVVIVVTTAAALFIGDWRRLHRGLGAQLVEEAERWLRKQAPPT